MSEFPLSRLRRLPLKGTTSAAGQSPFRDIRWHGLLRGLLINERRDAFGQCAGRSSAVDL